MDDKHDPNGSVPIGTFKATSEDGELEIPIEIVDDDEVDSRQLAIQTSGDDAFIRRHPDSHDHDHDSPDSPRRQRVATLLGVPMPGSGVKAIGRATGGDSFDPTKASRGEITAAVDDALDERPTTIYGYKRDGFSELEKIVESEMTEIPTSDPTDTTGELIGVVGDSTDTGTFKIEVLETPRGSMPVLAPAQFVEARARDSKSNDDGKAEAEAEKAASPRRAVPKPEVTARELAKLEGAIARETAKRERSGDEQPTAAIASRAERTEQDPRRDRVESEPPPKKPVSSLAPMEVKRAARPVAKREPASAIGYGLVAAMVLLGLGGWFFTAGGYRRSTDPAAPTAAASGVARPTDSLASPKLPTTPDVPPDVPAMPMPPVTEPAPTEQAAPAPAPKPGLYDGAPARPRVASKAVRKRAVVPPPATSGAIETPSRDDLLNGLDRIRTNVQACAEGRNGVAQVDLTIAANGIVTNALVGGDFGGTPQGSCIARAVRKARFPTFKQDRYRVLFPYVL